MNENQSVEFGESPWVEPFAGMFSRIRYQSWLLGLALMVNLILGVLLFRLSLFSSAHVYEITDGQTRYIGDREANLTVRTSEALFTAKTFVELIYSYNSSTVHQTYASALSMCSKEMTEQYRKEIAELQFLDKIRLQNIRSEMVLDSEEIIEKTDHIWRIRIKGHVDIYPLTRYEGSPERTRPFDVEVVLGVVPRHPDRPNGLEVVRLAQHQ